MKAIIGIKVGVRCENCMAHIEISAPSGVNVSTSLPEHCPTCDSTHPPMSLEIDTRRADL